MLLLALTLWMGHLVITSVGLIFVESDILRNGNEELLNSLEEGVIIQTEDTHEVVFINEVGKKISTTIWNDTSTSSQQQIRLQESLSSLIDQE